MTNFNRCLLLISWAVVTCVLYMSRTAAAVDLPEVKKSGILRHLGSPYGNFVAREGAGMDIELMQKFAKSLGVQYQFVKTDWDALVDDLIGKKVNTGEKAPETPVKGDLIANGFTILPWRQELVNFSRPTFPSQIWLLARADSKIMPIKPSRQIERDIAEVKSLLKGRKVLALRNTCLDPDLYNLTAAGADVIHFTGGLNDLAPAVIRGEAETAILDAPAALVALEKWPGKIKVIGPISPQQEMAVAFPKDSPQLRDAFDKFLSQSRKDGSYDRIVKKYYPTAPIFFPEFFKRN